MIIFEYLSQDLSYQKKIQILLLMIYKKITTDFQSEYINKIYLKRIKMNDVDKNPSEIYYFICQ